jgi:hypothetical protein
MGGRKLQNFGRRSYLFAAAMRVFHVLRESIPAIWEALGMAALVRTHRWRRRRQLTCRKGAPKTRQPFEWTGSKSGIQGEIRCAMYLSATP